MLTAVAELRQLLLLHVMYGSQNSAQRLVLSTPPGFTLACRAEHASLLTQEAYFKLTDQEFTPAMESDGSFKG